METVVNPSVKATGHRRYHPAKRGPSPLNRSLPTRHAPCNHTPSARRPRRLSKAAQSRSLFCLLKGGLSNDELG